MMGQEAFWSGFEVQLQARQAPGQMDVWDMLENTTDEQDEPTCETITRAQVRALARAGTVWTLTNHYITKPDHPCFGSRDVTVSRTTASRIYFDGDLSYVDMPPAGQVTTCPACLRFYGGGVSQGPADLFVTLVPR